MSPPFTQPTQGHSSDGADEFKKPLLSSSLEMGTPGAAVVPVSGSVQAKKDANKGVKKVLVAAACLAIVFMIGEVVGGYIVRGRNRTR